MKLSIPKNKATFVTATALLLMTIGGFATATEPIGEHPQYEFEEVAAECARAYDTQEQRWECIRNVCGFYGCSV